MDRKHRLYQRGHMTTLMFFFFWRKCSLFNAVLVVNIHTHEAFNFLKRKKQCLVPNVKLKIWSGIIREKMRVYNYVIVISNISKMLWDIDTLSLCEINERVGIREIVLNYCALRLSILQFIIKYSVDLSKSCLITIAQVNRLNRI